MKYHNFQYFRLSKSPKMVLGAANCQKCIKLKYFVGTLLRGLDAMENEGTPIILKIGPQPPTPTMLFVGLWCSG